MLFIYGWLVTLAWIRCAHVYAGLFVPIRAMMQLLRLLPPCFMRKKRKRHMLVGTSGKTRHPLGSHGGLGRLTTSGRTGEETEDFAQMDDSAILHENDDVVLMEEESYKIYAQMAYPQARSAMK
eukprot:1846106-Amphidinium_carterae.1